MRFRDARTPSTIVGCLGTYAVSVGATWAAQWLLWFFSGHSTSEPTAFGPLMLGLVFLFWFFMPPRYWFRRGSARREP
jgi:hypothetical protein